MRLFIGIPLNEGLRGYLQECLAVAHDRPLKIRPSPPANWHLTLAYLDEVTDDKMSTLTALLNDCAKKPPRGAFLIDRFETFPRKKPLRLAAHVMPADMVSWRRFVIQVRDYASIVASNIDRKPWQPHISIGKAPKRTILPTWSKSITEYAWVPDVFQLVRSNLTADGSVYETIAEYKLEL